MWFSYLAPGSQGTIKGVRIQNLDQGKRGGTDVGFGDHLCVNCANLPYVGWTYAINLPTQNSPDLIPTSRSLLIRTMARTSDSTKREKQDEKERTKGKGASIYEVRSGWGRGVPKKQTKGARLCEFCTYLGGGRGSKNPKIMRTSYMEAPKGRLPSSAQRICKKDLSRMNTYGGQRRSRVPFSINGSRKMGQRERGPFEEIRGGTIPPKKNCEPHILRNRESSPLA